MVRPRIPWKYWTASVMLDTLITGWNTPRTDIPSPITPPPTVCGGGGSDRHAAPLEHPLVLRLSGRHARQHQRAEDHGTVDGTEPEPGDPGQGQDVLDQAKDQDATECAEQ